MFFATIGATFDITTADIEFKGELVGGTIVYGNEDAEPLLGVTALESGGFEVDPRNEELKRLPAVLLKKLVQHPPVPNHVHRRPVFP